MDTMNKVSWPGWEVTRVIGAGGFGAVYEIRRDVFGIQEKAALKVLSIPKTDDELDELRMEGYDEESLQARFRDYLRDIANEYKLMSALKGHTNIVHCDDLQYFQQPNGVGWDLYIKMELLTPLLKALPAEPDEKTVIRIGMDIAAALAACRKRNIIHRDIKPQNMFVSEDGDYKLGDFGVAKTAERTASGTKTGTFKFMAPEVYNNRPYGHGVDIYSLGMVLHWLLNERRSPFLPMPPEIPKASDEDSARERRFRGEPVPAPRHGSAQLKAIVCKCVAFDPSYRYETPEQLHDALKALLEQPGEAEAQAPQLVPAWSDPGTATMASAESALKPAGALGENQSVTFPQAAPAWQTPAQSFQPQNQTFKPQAPSFQPQAQSFQPQESGFQPQAQSFQPQESGFQPQNQSFKPQNPTYQPQNQTFKPQAPSFQPQAQSFQPQNPSFQPQGEASREGTNSSQSASGQSVPQLPFVTRIPGKMAQKGAMITVLGPEQKQYYVQIPAGTGHGQMLWVTGRTVSGELRQFQLRVFLA